MKITYRKAIKKDLSEIINILNEEKGNINDILINDFLVAIINKKIIGCGRIIKTPEINELASVAVIKKYRNLGIGYELVKRLIKKEKIIYLICQPKFKHFYELNNFKLEKISRLPPAFKKHFIEKRKYLKKLGIKIITMKKI